MHVRIAIAAGRLQGKSVAWLRSLGWQLSPKAERALRVCDQRLGEIVAVRPGDIPWLVAAEAVDFGVVGEDVLGEWEGRPLAVGPRLGFGRCRLVVAGPEAAPWPPREPFRVATKYPRQAEAFLRQEGFTASVVPLKGSVEVAPHLGIADYIFDLVETGRTLRENDLRELEEVRAVEAVLVTRAEVLDTEAGQAFFAKVAAAPRRSVPLTAAVEARLWKWQVGARTTG